jgi:hypothetical protein
MAVVPVLVSPNCGGALVRNDHDGSEVLRVSGHRDSHWLVTPGRGRLGGFKLDPPVKYASDTPPPPRPPPASE